MPKERKASGRLRLAGPATGDPVAVPAARTFAYAIRADGGIRPVLTVSGSEQHRDEWIARAIAIAEKSATADEQAMVWEAEIASGGVGAASYVLVYPEVNEAAS